LANASRCFIEQIHIEFPRNDKANLRLNEIYSESWRARSHSCWGCAMNLVIGAKQAWVLESTDAGRRQQDC
jgi:hypothetical protein